MTQPIVLNMPTGGSRVSQYVRDGGVIYYQPHPGQVPFHQSDAKIRVILGGNRSGKTEGGAAEVAMHLLGDHRFSPKPFSPLNIWVGSESNEINRDVLIPKLRKWIPSHKILSETRIQRGFIDFWDIQGGHKIKFKNYEQGVDKWAGEDVDLIWLDEEPPSDVFKECLMRTIDRGGRIILTMTPVNGMTWVYQELYEKAGSQGIECFFMDMDINPYLTQVDKDLVLANLTEDEKKIRKEGKFISLTGLIYPQFKEERHVIEDFPIPKDWRRVVGIDPHLKKATSVVWMAVASENRDKIKRGDYVVYREARKQGETPDICAMIQVANGPHEKIYAYVVDPAKPNINEEWPGQSILDVYADFGIPAQKANKAVEEGIGAVRARLASSPPTLWIFNSCRGCIWEFKHYRYADPTDQAGKPYSEKVFKKEDDYVDCIRYLVNTGIPASRQGEAPSWQYKYSQTGGRIVGVQING